MRPDLEIKWIRGNIDTRLEKLEKEDYDAIILAAAGLSRMGWGADVVTEFLEPELCLPAVGQGALSIECRGDDEQLLQLLQEFLNLETNQTVRAERSFLNKMEGGCQIPIAGYAHFNEKNEIVLNGLVASPDGKMIFKTQMKGQDPEELGELVANKLIAKWGQNLN